MSCRRFWSLPAHPIRKNSKAANFQSMLETHLARTARFKVIERHRIDEVLAEQALQASKDRLEQFYRAGYVQLIPATFALLGMATKHFTSIADMAKHPEDFSLKKWNEKLTDLRNYTYLLDALVRDMGVE